MLNVKGEIFRLDFFFLGNMQLQLFVRDLL